MKQNLTLLSHAPFDVQRLDPARLARVRVDGLYVHIPFCFHKCHYCDFYSITHQSPQRMERFVDLILREADQWRAAQGPTLAPRTIFFGGGTPSLLPREAMRRLLSGLRERFDLSELNEWTTEANPATVDADYFAMLRERGVNRVSFGAQSFSVAELKMLERHHDPEDVPRGIELARAAGFERLNVDLIYAIPGQDMASWLASLEAAIALNLDHISCYALTYEPNTAMTLRKRQGQFRAVDDETELRMMHATRRRLAERGLRAYEISNYASAGQECRHNLLYWSGGSYIGLGPSAASHVEGTRWKNQPHLGEWENAVNDGRLPAIDVETLTAPQRAGEAVMLRLRLREGVDYADFAAFSGLDARGLYGDAIERLQKVGLLDADARGFRLSDAGLNVADAIAAEFLV